MKSKEQVNHPEHYNQYPVEAIEIMLKDIWYGSSISFLFTKCF